VEREALREAKILWDYLKLGHSLKQCDCVIAMGSHDLRVAEYAAELIIGNWAPLLVCSGGLGRLTRGRWQETEAVKFGRIAEASGVAKAQILLEDRSTNTGENILFSKALLDEKNIMVKTAILVHKPYMERRAFATATHFWPDLDVCVSSPPISFTDYAAGDITMENLINIIVGDFQRILVYPGKGYQSEQKVPKKAMKAFEKLVTMGFTHCLVAD
jgi:uncharacterized SAM-binding protein YcdF (DUF218 family)